MLNKKIQTATLISEIDQNVKRMLKLVEDGDSFAKKGEMYYEKRPELLGLVEEFSVMFHSLAECHDHMTVESVDIHSENSCISEAESELPSACASPDHPPTRRLGDESSSLDFESESEASSAVYDDVSRRKIYELEVELRGAKEKLRMHKENSSECSSTGSRNGSIEVLRPNIRAYEEELTDVKEKRQLSKDVKKLATQLSICKSMNVSLEPHEEVHRTERSSEVVEQPEFKDESGVEQNIFPLEEDLRMLKLKLHDSEKEVLGLREELKKTQTSELILQDQLRTMSTDATSLKGRLHKEEREVAKLCDRITKYKSNLSDRDEEIRRLKEALSIANKSLSEEIVAMLQKERSYLEKNLKELDGRCKSQEEDLRRAMAGKKEIETSLGAEIERLKTMVTEKNDEVEELTKSLANHYMVVAEKAKVDAKVEELTAEMSLKDNRIDAMCQHLNSLHMEQVKLMSEAEEERQMAEELRSTAKELETKINKQQEIIQEAAEDAREAIQQLSFSLNHYRVGYLRLRHVVVNHKRSPVR